MENVKQDASIGTNILRVSASDEDADNNGAIVYTLSAPYNPNDLEYFEIQPESGWIVLKKPLDVSHSIFKLFSTFCSISYILTIDDKNLLQTNSNLKKIRNFVQAFYGKSKKFRWHGTKKANMKLSTRKDFIKSFKLPQRYEKKCFRKSNESKL